MLGVILVVIGGVWLMSRGNKLAQPREINEEITNDD
jgi:hypothetical protein